MDFWNVVAAAAAVISIASVAVLGLQRGRVTSLREDVGDARGKIEEQRAEINDQRSEIDHLKRERAEDKATIARQSQDIAVLQKVVTGEVQWQAISDLLDHHHAQAEEHWANTERVLGEIRDEIRRTA